MLHDFEDDFTLLDNHNAVKVFICFNSFAFLMEELKKILGLKLNYNVLHHVFMMNCIKLV